MLFLPAIHGCGLGPAAEPAFGDALKKLGEITQIACPELAAGDVATLRARPPARPWTAEAGATIRQLKDAIDARDVALERKRLAGERVIAEHQRCAGRTQPVAPTS